MCIQQTCLDLLDLNYEVHVIADSVSSSRSHDWAIALHKLASNGVQLTSVESLIFELMRYGDHPKFKQMLKIIKDIPTDPI